MRDEGRQVYLPGLPIAVRRDRPTSETLTPKLAANGRGETQREPEWGINDSAIRSKRLGHAPPKEVSACEWQPSSASSWVPRSGSAPRSCSSERLT